METRSRIDTLRHELAQRDADAVLLTFLPDIRWACGFSGSNGILLVTREAAHFLSDGRYAEQAREEVEGAEVHIPGYDLISHLAGSGWLDDGARVLLQPEHVSLHLHAELTAKMPGVRFEHAAALLERHAGVKAAWEIERIRRAQDITDAVFLHLLSFLRPGMTEREVAAEIVYQHLRRGADRMSFETIVAAGPHGALPHARPTDRTLAAGDLVVLDFGCFVDGYASDMTRTIALGEPGQHARRVYEIVLKAQRRALDAVRAGLSTRALDQVARTVIAEAGFGDAFSHGLGHGVGLQIHEWPRVSYHVDDVLPAGAVVTIEPGIYLPGEFGVRIEDLVVVREGGSENLTRSPKDLLVL